MSRTSGSLTTAERRRALSWGLANGALWSAGNALTTGPLVSYLMQDLKASGLALSLMFAAPTLAGLMRLAAPAVIRRAGTARRACLSLSLASYLLIFGLPAIAAVAHAVDRRVAIGALIGVLFVHQLLEYLGTVALWSWWADLVPLPIRGRYFARRQVWQLCVAIPVMVAGAYFAVFWRTNQVGQPQQAMWNYALPAMLGAVCLLASLLPLAMMPATERYAMPPRGELWATIWAPFADRRFWRLLVFRAWFSLSNGISQTVQGIYPKQVLDLSVGELTTMRSVTMVGQLGASPAVGRMSDRFGNRPLLVLGQACVSASLLFFIWPTNYETRWLMLGAWILYAGYAAHNICLPNLILKLAPDVEKSAYVASYEALGSVCNAGTIILGGALFDWLRANSPDTSAEPYRSCLIILVLGLVMRSLGVVLLAAIREPGAWTWREILRGRRDDPGAQ